MVSCLQRASLCQVANQLSSGWSPKLSMPMGSKYTHAPHNHAEQGAGKEDSEEAEVMPGVDGHDAQWAGHIDFLKNCALSPKQLSHSWESTECGSVFSVNSLTWWAQGRPGTAGDKVSTMLRKKFLFQTCLTDKRGLEPTLGTLVPRDTLLLTHPGTQCPDRESGAPTGQREPRKARL